MDNPHLIIGHHPDLGVVAVNTLNATVTDHVLRHLDFQPRPGSRLYALNEPDRDPLVRAEKAISMLRTAGYRVDVDLDPGSPPRDPRRDYMHRPRSTPLVQAAVARSPPVAALHRPAPTQLPASATAPPARERTRGR